MRKSAVENHVPSSTVWAVHGNSCSACYNKPITADTGMNAPRYHGTYVSDRVLITLPTGENLDYCFVARCPTCGHIKNYEGRYLYRLEGRTNFYPLSWNETQKYHIDPEKVVDAVLKAKKGIIWLNLSDVQYPARTVYGGKYD